MKLALTGSIATDHLMRFPGRFADSLIADHLDKVSLSFLVDDLVIRRGGIAANIAYGMAQLGLRPLLVGAVGPDFGEYQAVLEETGVDCSSILVSDHAQTARCTITTDADLCQLVTFYAGAMAESGRINLESVANRVGGLDLVIISPSDPDAMVLHTQECRDQGYAFVADPSQQMARMNGEEIRKLVDDAAFLITNEYEKELLTTKTQLSDDQILERVGCWITTLGADGVRIVGRETGEIRVPVAQLAGPICDPTGVGDAFRSGFFAGISWQLPLERCAQVGSLMSALVLESVGTQEYSVNPENFTKRLAESYGEVAAEQVLPHLLAGSGSGEDSH